MLVRVRQDTVYGLGVVPVRFSVEAGVPESMIPVLAYPTLKKAIEQFEKLGDGMGHHYRFRDDIPIRFEYSHIQADPGDLTREKVLSFDTRLEKYGLIDCVAYLTFEQPLIVPNTEPMVDESDGVVPFEKLPQELRDQIADEEKKYRETFAIGEEETE